MTRHEDTEERLTAYKMRPGDQAVCYECEEPADVLAGPDHPPCNGNANYFCFGCLSNKAVVLDPTRQYAEVPRG